ncbi:Holliday junction resolvase RuvX [Bartonella sp. DGB1]|uniref:Holliday junction resolvase RuvX n=1 Tax=Bartonella sp. DGB1 TaxID=3239807 RepID=UPI003525B844
MPLINIEDIFTYLAKDQTIAALDLGTKTIGLAVSDLSLTFANPRSLLQRKKFSQDIIILKQWLTQENVGAVAIGLPLNMDGTSGARVQATKSFVSNFIKIIDIPIFFWDERLSTVAAERTLLEYDLSRKKRKLHIDSAAASFILQGVLDRISRLSNFSQNQ